MGEWNDGIQSHLSVRKTNILNSVIKTTFRTCFIRIYINVSKIHTNPLQKLNLKSLTSPQN